MRVADGGGASGIAPKRWSCGRGDGRAVPGHGVLLPVDGECMRRRARLPPPLEGLDDDHAPAAAGAWRADIDRFLRRSSIGRRRDGEQLAGAREAGLAGEPASRP